MDTMHSDTPEPKITMETVSCQKSELRKTSDMKPTVMTAMPMASTLDGPILLESFPP